MQLHFVPTESTFAYFEATRAYLERHGKPVAFYSDKASVFRSTQESTEASHNSAACSTSSTSTAGARTRARPKVASNAPT